MGYLPSKNFITLVFAGLVVLLVGWFVMRIWQTSNLQPQTSNFKSQTSFLTAYQDANRDSDNDGLKDWEEILWKTDPKKPDTDGDGTHDGEEIKQGRDPLAAGPNDKLKKPEEQSKASTTTPRTLTDKIAQEFAIQYLTAAGSAEGALDTFQQKAISESLIESLSRDALLYKDTFSPSDVHAEQNVSADGIKKYLNATGDFLNKIFAGLQTPEIDIVNAVLASERYEDLKKLGAYIAAYQKTIDFLKKQRVPANYASLHLDLMNILQNTAAADSFMMVTDKDPARGLMGLVIYFKQAERAPQFYKSMQRQIKNDGLNFAKSDGGYHFVGYGL